MSIQSEINRLTQAVSDTYSALNAKGATMPAAQTSAGLAATVASVPQVSIPATTAILKGDGAGGVSEAVAGTDYLKTAPVTSVDGKTGAVSLSGVYAKPTDITTKLNRTTAVNELDANYTTYMARGEALFSSETTPSINGAIAWQYE